MTMISEKESNIAKKVMIKAIKKTNLAISTLAAAFRILTIHTKAAIEEAAAFERAMNKLRREQKQRLIEQILTKRYNDKYN